MNAVERRIAMCKLAELVKERPDYAEELGVKVVEKIKKEESESKKKEL